MSNWLPAKTSILSPILPSPDGRHFVDQRGRPVFWLGDTLWELFRLFSPAEALDILRSRQAKGFNVILVMLLGVDVTKIGPRQEAPHANLEGEAPWQGNDPLCPNERYFQHIDAMIRLGEQTGQTFVVGVYHQWHAESITLPKARPWARWVAHRYRDVPNLIWCMYPKAEPAFVPVCRELAAGLREGDGGSHLISVHPDPSVASSSFLHGEEWLAFNMIQTWADYDKIHAMVTADRSRSPAKPVVLAEGHYEGKTAPRPVTPHLVRKQAYWSQLAGGYHVYGHDQAVRGPRNWGQWLDSPGAAHMKVFREVITSLEDWWGLVPDPSLLAGGAGGGLALNLAARGAAGNWIVAYLSEPATVSLRLDSMRACRRARAHWIDPRTGQQAPAGEFPAEGTRPFTTPAGWEDAFLIVQPQWRARPVAWASRPRVVPMQIKTPAPPRIVVCRVP